MFRGNFNQLHLHTKKAVVIFTNTTMFISKLYCRSDYKCIYYLNNHVFLVLFDRVYRKQKSYVISIKSQNTKEKITY